uniref:Uncharacterized protein n=1 Tax=Euplotes harpa TaxID=151035 RepID=A0A7S3NCS8_9SPIT|mmetsp:Transcript_32054/g.36588  ORF Transcript_32054/g.36588 Transcript_32054/m.36588 type:complete len:124 (+) Transcript_32054:303-674(+)
MLPEEVQKPLIDVMEETKHHSKATLHLYICYSSTQEYMDAIEKSKEQCESKGEEITQEVVESNFYVPNFEPDILIRTSDEIRLSNFLIYQTKNCQINFVKNFWPDFSIWDLLKIIIEYQSKAD